MNYKHFYLQYGYKEFLVKGGMVPLYGENVPALTKNRFVIKQLDVFLPVFLKQGLKHRTKLNLLLNMYVFFQFFFKKKLKVVFKNTFGVRRKLRKKGLKISREILGFSVTLKKNDLYNFIMFNTFFLNFFFFFENNNKITQNFIKFQIKKTKMSSNFAFHYNIALFFNFALNAAIFRSLNMEFLSFGSLNFIFNTSSLSDQLQVLRFLHFPFVFSKLN